MAFTEIVAVALKLAVVKETELPVPKTEEPVFDPNVSLYA